MKIDTRMTITSIIKKSSLIHRFKFIDCCFFNFERMIPPVTTIARTAISLYSKISIQELNDNGILDKKEIVANSPVMESTTILQKAYLENLGINVKTNSRCFRQKMTINRSPAAQIEAAKRWILFVMTKTLAGSNSKECPFKLLEIKMNIIQIKSNHLLRNRQTKPMSDRNSESSHIKPKVESVKKSLEKSKPKFVKMFNCINIIEINPVK